MTEEPPAGRLWKPGSRWRGDPVEIPTVSCSECGAVVRSYYAKISDPSDRPLCLACLIDVVEVKL